MEFAHYAQYFVMMHTTQDMGSEFARDGAYYPRIYFTGINYFNYSYIKDENGEPQEDVYNVDGKPEYKYYYSNAEGVIKSMKHTLSTLSPHTVIDTYVPEKKDELWRGEY